MPEVNFPYKSFCWSIGTTSFRTEGFNRTIERQLQLLNEFWTDRDNDSQEWNSNSALQEKYYKFMQKQDFVHGDAPRKDKDAREKTSGLVDIGLINDERRLTEAGKALLAVAESGDFTTDNCLQLEKDSYIYLKQLLKTDCNVDNKTVRPFIVLVYLLSKLDYLSSEECTYLLPLCVSQSITVGMVDKIIKLRNNQITIDEIIVETLLTMPNYKEALNYLNKNQVSEDVICCIGMNRKSRQFDKPYYNLYQELKAVCIDKESDRIVDLYNAVAKIKISTLWRKLLFKKPSIGAIKQLKFNALNVNGITEATSEEDFKNEFFRYMHLLKAKATLKDYYDLNRRYFRSTETVIYKDGRITLDILPKYYLCPIADQLFESAFSHSDKLTLECKIEEISPYLTINEQNIFAGVGSELGVSVSSMSEAKKAITDERLKRFNELIDSKFDDETLIKLLDDFKNRNNADIQKAVSDNADVPTIFEYILGIVWYKVSERKGNILDYMHLSLEADLLPKTHAGGGEADIEYYYSENQPFYPEHCMLLEATLADSTNQRRMEMEPVSRHLGEHILKHKNMNSYCLFATQKLHRNVISDFRNRKTYTYYADEYSDYVNGLKIIPINVDELKTILQKGLTYKDLYGVFEKAYKSNEPVPTWYDKEIIAAVNHM